MTARDYYLNNVFDGYWYQENDTREMSFTIPSFLPSAKSVVERPATKYGHTVSPETARNIALTWDRSALVD